MKKFIILLVLSSLGLMVRAQSGLPIFDLPDATYPVVQGRTMVDTARNRLVLANGLAQSIAVINPATRMLEAEIPVAGSPAGLALMPDGNTVVVVTPEGDLSLVNLETASAMTVHTDYPAEAIIAIDATSVIIAATASNALYRLEIPSGRELQSLDLPAPYGLTQWGDFLYVTSATSNVIHLVYLPTLTSISTLALDVASNLVAPLTIDNRSGLAYVTHTRTNEATNTLDNRLIPVLDVIDLARFQRLPERRILLSVADQPVSVPAFSILDSARTRLFVVNAGSADISVINLRSGLAETHIRTGIYPRTMAFSRDGLAVYVHHAVDTTLGIFDARFFGLTDLIPLTNNAIVPDVQIGASLFFNARATAMSANPTISCAGCHLTTIPNARPEIGALAQHIEAFNGGVRPDDETLFAILAFLRQNEYRVKP